MKAVLVRAFGPPASASVEDVPAPRLEPGHVLIAVEAAETNYPDILVIEGRYQFKPPLPFTPGKGAAGRVVEAARDVTAVRAGDRVAVQIEYGAYAQLLCVPASTCLPLPEEMPSVEAAALGLAYQTAWFALRERARFAAPETVLVLGAAGGVGVAAIQLAKAMGSRMVIAATRGDAKAATIRRAGADAVVDVTQPNLRDALREQVRSITGADGVDVVLDPVGGAVSEAALRALAWCGRLVVIGFAAGEIPAFRANYLLVKNIAVSGLQWSDYRDRRPDLMRAAHNEIVALWQAGLLTPIVSGVLPLGRFTEALDRLREGEAEGKIILRL